MKKIQKVWTDWHKYDAPNLKQQIQDMDIFDLDLCKILLRHFKPHDLVLEAGSGYGRVCFWLHQKGMNIIALEIVSKVLRESKDYAKLNGIPATFLVGDVRMLPFKDKSVDGYVSLGVLENFQSEKQRIQTVRESKRVLKIDGKAVITVPNLVVSLRHRMFLTLTRGRTGLFHVLYTVKTINRLGKFFGNNYEVQVLDIWTPVFNIFTVLFHRLKFNRQMLRVLKLAFGKLPQSVGPLKNILGHIYLIVDMDSS